jgi:hypothetical protein
MDIAVSTSMKLVDSDGTLSADIDAPENDGAPVSGWNLNQLFKV